MFKKQTFIKSVYNLTEVPKIQLPEVILCGRSNVGKSSFINSLFNRKALAKISSTPGKTRSINYYNIDDIFYLIDLPGYGYAKTSKKERESWGKLVTDFISGSNNHNKKSISFAFHFIDSRHEPTGLDIQLNELLRFNKIPYIVLLNKIDKLNQSEIALVKRKIKEFFPELILNENLILYSATKKRGKEEVLRRLENLFYHI